MFEDKVRAVVGKEATVKFSECGKYAHAYDREWRAILRNTNDQSIDYFWERRDVITGAGLFEIAREYFERGIVFHLLMNKMATVSSPYVVNYGDFVGFLYFLEVKF